MSLFDTLFPSTPPHMPTADELKAAQQGSQSPAWLNNLFGKFTGFLDRNVPMYQQTSWQPGQAFPTVATPTRYPDSGQNNTTVNGLMNSSTIGLGGTPVSLQGSDLAAAFANNGTANIGSNPPAGLIPGANGGPTDQSGGGNGGGRTYVPPMPVSPNPEDTMRAMGLSQDQIDAVNKKAADLAGKTNLVTTNINDMNAGKNSQYQDLLTKAINYYMGYDTSPEAQRIRDLTTQIGKIQGAERSALAQIETTPGLSTFQAGRRQQALNQAAGNVLDPLTAELNALTNQQTQKQTNMQNALNIAQLLKPTIVGSPITDAEGNVAVLQQNPMTGQMTTIQLGKIGQASPKSADVAEYQYAKGQGYQGDYLSWVRAKAQAAKVTGSSGADVLAVAAYADDLLNRRIAIAQVPATIRNDVVSYIASSGGKIPKPLTAKQQDAATSAVEGIAAIDKAKQEYNANPNVISQYYLPFGLGRLTGASQYIQAIKNATDLITRTRTGAALNNEEQSFYQQLTVPAIGEKPADVLNKFNQLKAYYQGISGMPVTLYETKNGVATGKVATWEDLFNPQQRLDMRNAVNAGWVFPEDVGQ